jgi:hypothetical protein
MRIKLSIAQTLSHELLPCSAFELCHHHGHHDDHAAATPSTAASAAAAALPAADTGVEGQQAACDYLALLQIAHQHSSDTTVLDDGSPADIGEVLHLGLLQELQQMATAADLERRTQPLKAAVGHLLED